MNYNGNSLNGNEVFVQGDIISFAYVGSPKAITLPPGEWLMECWGAKGGNALGGRGAYAKGILALMQETEFFVYVGRQGYNQEASPSYTFNGGGTAYTTYNVSSGGGASDIRLVGGSWDNAVSLRSRILVAAGGGGMSPNWNRQGGHGGALTGFAGASAPGGGASQTGGGYAAAQAATAGGFGYGGRGGWQSSGSYVRSGAGSGYYGGGGGEAAGGGSSFVSGYPGCNAVNLSGAHTNQPNHYSGIVFNEPELLAGNVTMPNTAKTGTMVGNAGDGFVRFELISPTNLNYLVTIVHA